MKPWYFILIFSIIFHSCIRRRMENAPIPVKEVFGTYDLTNGKTIIFNTDFTYRYSYFDSLGVIVDHMGVWYYYYSPTRLNRLMAFDMRAVSETGERNYFTRYATFYFYVCESWGEIIITPGYEGDPDSAPIHWYRKLNDTTDK